MRDQEYRSVEVLVDVRGNARHLVNVNVPISVCAQFPREVANGDANPGTWELCCRDALIMKDLADGVRSRGQNKSDVWCEMNYRGLHTQL